MAAPAGDAPGTSSTAPRSAPTTGTEVAVAPSAAGVIATATATEAAPTPRSAAAPRTAAAPAETQTTTTTTTTSPGPRRTATSTPAASPTRAPTPSAQFALTIRDFAFSPRLLTVPAGSTVTVTNEDDATHDWTSDSGVWRSGALPRGASYSFTFTMSGTFGYLCERHPHMTGTVTVTPR